jgi:hypothetical protein
MSDTLRGVNQLSHLFTQDTQLVRLEQEPIFGRQCFRRGSGPDHHPEPRPPLAGTGRQFQAVNRPRHIDVREQNLDALGLLAEYAQRLFGMTCLENLKAVVGQNFDNDCAQHLIVFRDDDAARAIEGRGIAHYFRRAEKSVGSGRHAKREPGLLRRLQYAWLGIDRAKVPKDVPSGRIMGTDMWLLKPCIAGA